MRLSAVLALAIALAGCVSHRATIRNPEHDAQQATLGGTYLPKMPEEKVYHEQLPQDVLVSAWRRDEKTGLFRFHGRSRTPLAWWQRFPFDFVTDVLTPHDFVCADELTIQCAAVKPEPNDEWLKLARRDGYFHDAPTTPAKP